MPAAGTQGRNVLIANIDQQLGAFVSAAKIAIKKNLPSYNVVSETTLAGLLNLIHGWNLVNANSKKQNFPGVDLIDIEARVAVQVTSTNKPDKVDHTLEQFSDKNLGAQFDKLIILVITDANPTPAMCERKLLPWFSGETDIWNITKVSDQIQNLQNPTLVERICDYLNREVGSFVTYASSQHLYLPLSSTLDRDSFVGRETEMEEIWKKLRNGTKPIILSGLGGMGKTELAVRFGKNYEEDRKGNVFFIRFEDSFTRTLAKMANGIRPALSQDALSRPDEELSAMVLDILEDSGENDILIVDNVDADSGTLGDLMKDAAYKAMKALKLRLILTTRFDEARSVGIHPMPNDTLYEIFEKHGASLARPQMDELIKAVNGHTLTIDLMARILNGKGWRKVTPEMLLTDLQTNALPNAQYRKIATDYNQSEDQAQIYQHLSVVFDATGVPEDGKAVLRCATLLPEGGMNGEFFHEALTESQQQAFEILIDHGWLNAKDGIITIHPVIRLVCREELKPNEETCGKFLDALWGQIGRDEYDRLKFAQMAEVFAAAMEIDGRPETTAHWLNRSGCLWNDLMESRKATALYERYIPELEQKIPAHPTLATAYNNVGSTYGDLGDHRKALEYKLKDLSICEKVLPPEHPDLAASYNNVGTTYGNLGDHSKALEFKLKALEIKEKVLPPEHPSLAASYSNVGSTYGALGDHNKALECKLKALAIRKKVLPPEHPDLATSYNNVGSTYGALGDHNRALEYQLKDLAICEQVLPPEHPHLATSYNNVGTTYGALGDHSKALEYLLKALAIREKVLPPEHPHLATSYSNVGVTYFYLKQYAMAMEYLEKALAIREQSLPAGHPYTEGTRQSIEALRTWLD